MNSSIKLWVRFRDKFNDEIQIALTPVLFWHMDESGEYVAYVLSPMSIHPLGYAVPCTHKHLRKAFGDIDGFILHENIEAEITKLKEWVEKDSDGRSLYVYPSV